MRNRSQEVSTSPGELRIAGWARTFLLAPGLVLLMGCFEDPVEEVLALQFSRDSSVEIRYQMEVHGKADGENPAFSRRVRESELALAQGWSPWLQGFDELGAESEGMGWERKAGRLENYERWVQVDDPQWALGEILGSTPIEVVFSQSGDESELAFYPTQGDRASHRERLELAARLGAWAQELSRYLAVAMELWRYVDENPGRRQICLEALFDEMDEEEREVFLSSPERDLVKAHGKAAESVAKVFELEEGEAFTLIELSRKVFDPFPAELIVEVEGRVLEAEGFTLDDEDRLRIPRVDVWDGYRRLEGRWLSPDPLLRQIELLLTDSGDEFDWEALQEQELFYADSPPTAKDIEEAILEALVPEPVYRVLWDSSLD